MKRHVLALVAAGGAIGAGLRYLAFEAWPVAPGTFPTSTLCINVAGALLLGIVMARLASIAWARPLLGIGILGGLTTMSTLAVETAALSRAGDWALASTYVVVSIVFGASAAWAGLRIGRR